MKTCKVLKICLVFVLMAMLMLSAVACGSGKIAELEASVASLQNELQAEKDKVASLEGDLQAANDKLAKYEAAEKHYDFYITLGTLPTLYATLNAYTEQNPNTYMWFYRGNTISYMYSAPYINYFPTQSVTNAYSAIDYAQIRDKVEEILAKEPNATFHLYCDDLRVRFISDIFVYAGVDFEDLQVTLLSDGTGTYSIFDGLDNAKWASQPATWQSELQRFTEGRATEGFTSPYDNNGQAMELQDLAFYVSTFDNVDYWVQNPDYLLGAGTDAMAAKSSMNIVAKDPKAMYNALDESTRKEYQKAVLANALVNSTTLTTLEQAAAYFDEQLSNRDKDVVLILGTDYDTLAQNQFYIDSTIAFYTPTVSSSDPTKVIYKNQEYTITAGATTVTVDGKSLTIGELGVYLFFKGHPAYPAQQDLQDYFAANGIEVLPHRTPVETLFWMYDVKIGGYQSTSYLSSTKGQTEFMYELPTASAIVQMKNAGFFDNAVFFVKPTV